MGLKKTLRRFSSGRLCVSFLFISRLISLSFYQKTSATLYGGESRYGSAFNYRIHPLPTILFRLVGEV